MRRQADSNRRTRFCRPLPNRSAMSPSVISKKLVRPTGVEPVTYALEGRCSIQLSYGRSTYTMSKKTRFSGSKPKNLSLVGETRFELATLRSQSECATGLRHSPDSVFKTDSKDTG